MSYSSTTIIKNKKLMKIQLFWLMIQLVVSEIVQDGLWTGHDVDYVSQNIKVRNGVASKIVVDGGVWSAWMRDLDSSWAEQSNVLRVAHILTQSVWDHLFPYARSMYSRDDFLRAVGRYNKFCDDYDDVFEASEMCKKELSTVLTHIIVDTSKNNENDPNIPPFR